MSEQTRIEWCGNIQVHHPVKVEPDTRSEFRIAFDAEVERKVQWHNQYVAPIFEFWHEFDKRNAA